jgi:hypothetical protein
VLVVGVVRLISDETLSRADEMVLCTDSRMSVEILVVGRSFAADDKVASTDSFTSVDVLAVGTSRLNAVDRSSMIEESVL